MPDADPVRASYDRCMATGDFAGDFYALFFTKSPEIPPLFAHTNFVEQKRHLRASTLTLAKYAPGDPVTTNLLKKIGASHSRTQRNIRPGLYPIFVETLLETIRTHDPEWTPELEQQWTRQVLPAIEIITGLY